MKISYRIIQSVESVNACHNEIIMEISSRRIAVFEYDRLKKEYPNEYFELIEIRHEEICLYFTPETKKEKP